MPLSGGVACQTDGQREIHLFFVDGIKSVNMSRDFDGGPVKATQDRATKSTERRFKGLKISIPQRRLHLCESSHDLFRGWSISEHRARPQIQPLSVKVAFCSLHVRLAHL